MISKFWQTLILFLFLFGLSVSAQTVTSVNVADSLSIQDSSFTVQYDTLKPIFVSKRSAILNDNRFFTKSQLNFKDYIYLGDWFNYLPFGYLQNLGVMGFPNELNYLGAGNSELNIFVDGLDFSDRTGSGLDAYSFRSEIVDTIEYLNSSASILNSNLNNTAAINLISRDKIAVKPLTKIRYYQAPNDEGFIDAQFNLYPFKRFNISAGVTNRSVASDYKNSEYGIWKGSINARYMLNNTFNFLLNYYYTDINAQLNGGVDYDKILRNYSSNRANEILYSPIEAPVNFTERYQKITNNKVVFRSLMKLFGTEPVILDLYYFSGLKEFRQNEDGLNNAYAVIKNNNRSKTIGGKLSYKLSLSDASVLMSADYERNNYNLHTISSEGSFTKSSLSVLLKKSYLTNFVHSAFGKYLNYNNSSYFSAGTNIDFRLTDFLRISGGYTYTDKPLSVYNLFYLPSERKISEQELNVSANMEMGIGSISLSYFKSVNENAVWYLWGGSNDSLKNHYVNSAVYGKKNNSGFNLSAAVEYMNILLEVNSSYYLQKNNYDLITLPEWTFTGGLYYVDTLFNRNLKMKAGVNLYAQGKQSYRIYDFEKMLTAYLYNDSQNNLQSFNQLTRESYQIDLFFSGMIRDRAIVYLILENLTDNKYFTVPYYPRKGISFRFGFAWELYN